jgi:predicted glycoside hydrolase/deacetylase ChbG (UPF0249 family)
VKQTFPRPIPIVLCADDYGLAPGLGIAIRELIAAGRISATSCMTVGSYWPDEAEALRPLADRADIGLHLTLTDQRPLGPMPRIAADGRLPSISRMIRLAYFHRLDPREIKGELTRQLDLFEAALGRPPVYLDGHQHVHQLPIVREAVLELYRERLARHGAYLRYCTEPLGTIFTRRHSAGEALAIAILGWRFARRARANGIPGNHGFSGVHDFSGRIPYPALFGAFLEGVRPGALVMCHPGLSDAALAAADRVTTAREEEYQFLKSDAFSALLRAKGVSVARFGEIQAQGRTLLTRPAAQQARDNDSRRG